MYQIQCMYVHNQLFVASPYGGHFLIHHGCPLYRAGVATKHNFGSHKFMKLFRREQNCEDT